MPFRKVDVSKGGASVFPEGVFSGERAITVDSFEDAHAKKGELYFSRLTRDSSNPLGTSGDARISRFSLESGVKPITIKSIIISHDADYIEFRAYYDQTYSASNDLPISNYNVDSTIASTATIKDISTTYISASGGWAFRPQDAFKDILDLGSELVIGANSGIVIQLLNETGSTARSDIFVSWYEGDNDLPTV